MDRKKNTGVKKIEEHTRVNLLKLGEKIDEKKN